MSQQLFLFPDVEQQILEQEKIEYQQFIDSLPYFANPQNDNERLFNYQYEYLHTGSKSAENKLWASCLTIAGKIINKERAEKGFYLDQDSFEDKKIEAVIYMLRRYNKTYRTTETRKYKYWAVKTSFIAAIHDAVQHALHYEQNNNQVKVIYVGDFFDTMQYKESLENET